MKKFLYAFRGLALLLATYSAGFVHGEHSQLWAEFRLYSINARRLHDLGRGDETLAKYLTARMYFCLNRISRRWVTQEFDFGPVTNEELAHLPIGKDATSPEYEYRVFREKLDEKQRP